MRSDRGFFGRFERGAVRGVWSGLWALSLSWCAAVSGGAAQPSDSGPADAGGEADAPLPALSPIGKGFPEPAPAAAPAEPAAQLPPPSASPSADAGAPDTAAAGAATPAPGPAPAAAAPTMANLPPPSAAPVADATPAGPTDLRATHPVELRFRAGRGFELRTPDGAFAVAIGAGIQGLYTAVLPDADVARQYLELRRARLRFGGNLFGVHNQFYVQLALSPRDLGREPVQISGAAPGTDAAGDPATPATAVDVVTRSPLLDAWLHFDHLRDLNLRVGQFRVPFSRQRLMPFTWLHFADRSLANAEFGLDRDLGVMLSSPDFLGLERLRYFAGVFIGEGRDSSSRTLGAGDLGMQYVARVELTPFGRFDDDYADVDFERRSAPDLSVGVAYALLQGDAISPLAKGDLGTVYETPGEEPLIDYNAHNFTVDAMFKVAGLSLQSAFHYRQIAPIANARDGLGVMVDAGYLLPPIPLELIGAFSMTRATGSDSSLDEGNELGFGLSYYFVDQFLKLEADLFHLWAPDAFSRGSERIRVQFLAGF